MKTKNPTSRNQQDLKRVGECLYRSQNSNIYYAIFKKGGKQIKRSLRTTDGPLARRKLKDLKDQVVSLPTGSSGKASFSEIAERWLKAASLTMKPSSATRQAGVVKSLSKTFGPVHGLLWKISVDAAHLRQALRSTHQKESIPNTRHDIQSVGRTNAQVRHPC